MSNQVRALLPLSSSNLIRPITWLDSSVSSSIALSGSQVLSVASVYGDNAYISDNLKRPILVNNALNGFSVWSSNNATGFVYNDTISQTLTAQAIYIVASYANSPTDSRMFGQGRAGIAETAAGNFLPLYRNTSLGLASYYNAAVGPSLGFVANQWTIFQSIHYGTSIQNAANGVYSLLRSNLTPLNVTPNVYSLGASHLKNLIANASFSQLIFLDFAPTDTLDKQIQGHLAHKCGISSALPSNHPWKNNNPGSPFASP
jgi:hypothetical protein